MRKIKLNAIVSEFGAVVRKRRHELGLSQEEFAEHANIHRTYVSSIELGKTDIGAQRTNFFQLNRSDFFHSAQQLLPPRSEATI